MTRRLVYLFLLAFVVTLLTATVTGWPLWALSTYMQVGSALVLWSAWEAMEN